ncbi:unnamed protein product [Auanema sp. JU1783]|nr:unnamed protein product [Auanema sp. JU1783]
MRFISTLSICLLIFTGVASQSETDPDIFDFESTVTTRAPEPEFSFDSEVNEGSDVFEVSTAVVGLFSEPMEIDSPSKALAAAAAAANDQKSTESIVSENDGENEENIPDPFGNYDLTTEDDSKTSSASTSPTTSITSEAFTPEATTISEVHDATSTTSLPTTEETVVSVTDQVLETRVLKEKEEAVTSSFKPSTETTENDVTTVLPQTSSESIVEVAEVTEPEISSSSTQISEEPVTSSLTPSTSTEDSESEGEPFDSEGLSGLFEPDGSPTQITREETPAFPIVQLPEENDKILENKPISISPSSFSPTASTETLEITTSDSSENDFSTTPIVIAEERTTSEDVISSSTIMPIEMETVATADESSIEELTDASTIPTSTEQPIIISSESSSVDVTTESTTESVVSSTTEKTETTNELTSTTTTTTTSESTTSTPLTSEATSQINTSAVASLANRPAIPASYKADLVLRLTDLDYVLEFGDEKSGKFNKLREQVTPQVTEILKEIIGHNFVSYEIQSFKKGSVIVNGDIITRNEIANVEEVASKIESHISHNSQKLGQHTVDPRSITVNGIASRNFIEHIQASYETSAPSVFLIGSVITIAVIVVLVVAILVIFLYNRRSNGGMKLKEDELSRTEKGSTATYDNPTTPVNLKSYNNPDHKPTTPSMVSDSSDHTVPIHF